MLKFFSRSKSSPAAVDLSGVGVDIHSHLLPGIDDGSPDLETSIKLIRGLNELGYKKLVTTPHIMWDMYQNTHEIISTKLSLVQEEVKKQSIPVEIGAAAEYFLDDHVAELLKNNTPLLTISGNLVLVEFSMAFPSHSLKDILFEMQMKNYQPVIAHPERYLYLEKNKDFYEELRDIGCLFQLNLLSTVGYYGRSAQDLAQHLIKKNYYDLVGTDLHSFRHLDALHNPTMMTTVTKLLDTGKIRNSGL